MTGTSDLLADLQVDQQRTDRRPPAARVPAFELRLTPLHWSAPRLHRTRAGWTVAAGPLQAALLLGLSEPVRFGVVGYGSGGRLFHTALLAGAPGCELVGVVTTSPDRRAQLERDLPGTPALDSLADLVAAGAQAVAISTPAATHVPLTLEALERGLAVVCDKPFAPDAAQAREVVALAQRLGRPLSAYQNRRFDSDFRTVQRLAADGTLGTVRRLESRFERFRPDRGPGAAGGGMLLDLGSHLVDQALVLLGPVTRVYADWHLRDDALGLDDDVSLALEHEGGGHSQLWMSLLQGAPGPRFRVTGTTGTYVVGGLDGQEAALVGGARPAALGDRVGGRGRVGLGPAVPRGRRRAGGLRARRVDSFYPAFAAAVRGEGPVPVDPRDTVALAVVLDAARRGASTGRPSRWCDPRVTGSSPDDEEVDVTETGVLFPRGADGHRSTATTGRAVWADAVRGVDPALADRIEAARDWRKDYVDLVVAHTAAATATDKGAVEVARSGLESLAGRLRFERDGGSLPVAAALAEEHPPLGAQVVRGEGDRERGLTLPYRGEQLRGDALRRQVDAWVAGGVMEQSCGRALHRVLDEPDWLDVSDRAFALLGAGAELGPLEPLSRWGAHVVAVDVPSARVWDRVTATARAGSGTLTSAEGEPGTLGVDLLTRTPEVAAFLRTAAPDLPLTIGSYAYADGARHVQVVHASDAVVELLLRERPGTGYAELATPTDAFAVPAEVVEDARRRWASRGVWGALQAPARAAGLYAPAYPTTVLREDGSTVGIADVLVPQQGPNYTLAKRVQRWRAVVAQADGFPVSANVAPATSTRSVTKNRLLAAAYAGAGRFGVEVFDPRTSRVLMAALLVHDLRVQAPAPAHPDDLFVSGAAHGFLWRVGYRPRSVLGIAAVLGLPATLRR